MKRCIFCGSDSSCSKSVEHIVPESFGNKSTILHKGIVCDKCNNYFARKVEQPFLESEPIRKLRQELQLTNKKGKTIEEYQYPKIGENQVKQISDNSFLIYSTDEKSEKELEALVQEYQQYLLQSDSLLLEENIYLSRLLAKMALEYFVYRCGQTPEVCDYILEDDIFSSIRSYARYGERKIWPYSVRRIYARDESYKGDVFSSISWEADFLFTELGEVYFVIAMHGIEYAINLGGPFIEGYEFWLKKNKNKSPLYISNEIKKGDYKKYLDKIASSKEMKYVYEFEGKKEDDNDE